MLHSPFFSAFSGTQEMQPHTLAAGLADLKEGSQWGGRSRIGEVQGEVELVVAALSPGHQGSLAFCFSPHHTGLTASWSQEGSQAPDIWTQNVLGWSRQWDTRDDNEHSMISFCLSV